MSHCTSAVISYVSHSQHCTADKLGRPHTHNVIVTREAPRVKFPVLVKHPCKLRLDRTRKKQSGDISHQCTILSVLRSIFINCLWMGQVCPFYTAPGILLVCLSSPLIRRHLAPTIVTQGHYYLILDRCNTL